MSSNPIPPSRPEDPGENDEADDSVIGRAAAWSGVVLLVLAVIGVGVWWWKGQQQSRRDVQVTALSAPQTVTNRAAAEVPRMSFTDVTVAAGIRFRHETGAAGEKLLPETMGGGVGLGDLDGDGDPDLVLVNGSHWPWGKPAGAGDAPPGVVLYRNDTEGGTIRFVDVTLGSGVETPFYGMGVALGDADGDGRLDLLITGVGGVRLYLNRGDMRFEDGTEAAGVGGAPGDWSTAAVWFDMDRDGDLDLFVANYVKWSREEDARVGYKIDGVNRAYGPPMNFQGSFSRLYRNEGKGRFTEVSGEAGVQVRNPATGVPVGKTLGLVAVDVNRDGWLDLLAANDTVQNFLFINQRDGTFREVGAESGVAFDSYGNPRGAMGVDAARFTKEGRLGLAIGNFANEMTALYVESPMSSTELPQYTDEAISWGIGGVSRDPLKFGVFFFDYDLDGRLDLLSVNGHLEEEIAKLQQGQQYRQAAQLFWNAGDAGFIPVKADRAGADLFQLLVGRGSAFADVDGDGDLDCVLGNLGGSPVLLRNDQQLGHGWLRVRLEGTGGNRQGLGGLIRIRVAGGEQWRTIGTTRSYLSSSEPVATFGLGKAAEVEGMWVTWPDGYEQEVKVPGIRREMVVRRE